MILQPLNINKAMFKQMRKAISIVILTVFICTSVRAPAYAQVSSMPFMPKPGVMVHLSPEFTPAYLKGIVIHPENALKFDFIVYKGDKELTDDQKQEEYTKLTKYFLASLAIPDDDQWVNLSPYEKDRIIKDDFGKTEMGRDLLAQDYMLKQITASLIYPEDDLGKKFWDKVYTQAQEQFGTTNIPVNTFNKVWILPDDALIYEKGNTAYVLKNHLRVMLEEDYLSLKKHSGIQSAPTDNKTHSIASKIVKEIVLPELEKEVNEGKNFAALRQVYSGMLLATWYKRALKESLLSKIYANKAKVKGVDQPACRQAGIPCETNEEIYQKYLKAYKKGVFNFIKEDVDKYTNETIPRKYFSGGAVDYVMALKELGRDPLKTIGSLTHGQNAAVATEVEGKDDYVEVAVEESEVAASQVKKSTDAAMNAKDWLIVEEFSSYWKQLRLYKGEDHIKIVKRIISDWLLSKYVPAHEVSRAKDPGRSYTWKQARRVLSNTQTNFEKVRAGKEGTGKEPVAINQKNPSTILDSYNIAGSYENYREVNKEKLSEKQVQALNQLISNLRIENRNIMSLDELWDLARKSASGIYDDTEAFVTFIRDEAHPWAVTNLPKGALASFINSLGTVPQEAALAKYGGIDLNAVNLNLQIKRDGKGVPLPISQQNLENIHINGLIPVILDIKPALETPLLSELQVS